MNGDTIFAMIIITFSSLICAGAFYGIGVWAAMRKDPMHFYSGTTVDPRTISDIPAYNRENAKMWKYFSVPFWVVRSVFYPQPVHTLVLHCKHRTSRCWLHC